MGEELGGGEVAEGLMGADGIIGMFPGAEFTIQGGEFESGRGDFIKFLGRGTVGTFDVAVELGGARGQEEEFKAPFPAGLFERGGELAAAVNL